MLAQEQINDLMQRYFGSLKVTCL